MAHLIGDLRNMKTNLLPAPQSRRTDLPRNRAPVFPVTDSNYHVPTLPKFGGGCARSRGCSFRSISHEYFRSEARGEFQCELVAFGAIVIATILPVLSNAHALVHFLRSIGTV